MGPGPGPGDLRKGEGPDRRGPAARGDWCLEATAWRAANKDYYVAVVGDCTRSPRPAGHEAALRQFRDIGLDVTTSEELLPLWEG